MATRVWRAMEEYDTSDAGAHANWPERFFSRLVDSYLVRTNNSGGYIGDAECFLLASLGLFEFASSVMKAVAADPRAADSLHA